jgi:hypothetical protein
VYKSAITGRANVLSIEGQGALIVVGSGDTVKEPLPSKFARWIKWVARFVLLPALRCVQALLVVMLAGALGYRLAHAGFLKSLSLGGTEEKSLSIISFISAIKELTGVLPRLWIYIKTGSWPDLYGFSSFIFATSLTLGVALWIGSGNPNAKTPDQDLSATRDSVLFVRPGHEPTFLVPFSEEATKPNNDCSLTTGFNKGLDPIIGSEAFLAKLMDGLHHCGVEKPVRIVVRGFASSSEFKGCSNSKDINLLLAKQRAEIVIKKINEYLSSKHYEGQIIVTPDPWTNFPDMHDEAYFNDRKADGTIDIDRADLTRRADVAIVDAADCEQYK